MGREHNGAYGACGELGEEEIERPVLKKQSRSEGCAFERDRMTNNQSENVQDITIARVDTETAHFDLAPTVKNVVLRAPGGTLILELTASGMALRVEGDLTLGASGTLRLEGQSVSIQAQDTLEINAAAQAIVRSEGVTTIQGGLVEIN